MAFSDWYELYPIVFWICSNFTGSFSKRSHSENRSRCRCSKTLSNTKSTDSEKRMVTINAVAKGNIGTLNFFFFSKRKISRIKVKAMAIQIVPNINVVTCLLYTSDAADDLLCVDLGGRRI